MDGPDLWAAIDLDLEAAERTLCHVTFNDRKSFSKPSCVFPGSTEVGIEVNGFARPVHPYLLVGASAGAAVVRSIAIRDARNLTTAELELGVDVPAIGLHVTRRHLL